MPIKTAAATRRTVRIGSSDGGSRYGRQRRRVDVTNSPAGTALLGKRAGATVKISSGPGALDFTIQTVTRATGRSSGLPSDADSSLVAEQPEA